MQTAVEWLFKEIWNSPKDKFTWYSIYEQAKEMEKQQIIDAWDSRNQDVIKSDGKTADQYYNETYGSKGSDETKTDKI
jgi:hypothetical protein